MVLPYIDMNPPRVYMRSQAWTPLPPPSPQQPSGSSPCTSPKHAVSCVGQNSYNPPVRQMTWLKLEKRFWYSRHFIKEKIQVNNKHMKKCTTLLVFREKQIIITIRFYLTFTKMTFIQATDSNVCWYGCEETGFLYILGM